ncbi:MAG: hypothetical protein IIB87_04480 [Chloroflexi bacterium]|nr:hypothetical protein [Chloroflexota bacterium]
MNVLLIGSGAREHVIAWKLRQSPRLDSLVTMPGNPGTAECGTNIAGGDNEAVVRACREHRIDLAVVGGEEPLAAGLVDRLAVEGIAAFGPTAAAAASPSTGRWRSRSRAVSRCCWPAGSTRITSAKRSNGPLQPKPGLPACLPLPTLLGRWWARSSWGFGCFQRSASSVRSSYLRPAIAWRGSASGSPVKCPRYTSLVHVCWLARLSLQGRCSPSRLGAWRTIIFTTPWPNFPRKSPSRSSKFARASPKRSST